VTSWATPVWNTGGKRGGAIFGPTRIAGGTKISRKVKEERGEKKAGVHLRKKKKRAERPTRKTESARGVRKGE